MNKRAIGRAAREKPSEKGTWERHETNWKSKLK